MPHATRIDPRETRKKIESGEALLVCAYDDEEKCNQMHLEGAMHLQELEEKLAEIPKEKELIFYCAWPQEATSAGRAEEFEKKGFTHAEALQGGVEAWKKQGYRMEKH